MVKDDLLKWWNNLEPNVKKNIVTSVVVVCVVAAALGAYGKKNGGSEVRKDKIEKKQEISLDAGTLHKTQLMEAEKAKEESYKQIQTLQKQIDDIKTSGLKVTLQQKEVQDIQKENKKQLQNVKLSADGMTIIKDDSFKEINDNIEKGKKGKKTDKNAKEELPPIPPPAFSGAPLPPPNKKVGNQKGQAPTMPALPTAMVPGQNNMAMSNLMAPTGMPSQNKMSVPSFEGGSVSYTGGIEVVAAKKEDPLKKIEEAKKKELVSVYLPPSFMEASLLSGLDAPTAEGGKGNPVPALLRIKDLAVLPNKVKANLKGCFVIAEGVGSLSEERANLRLVSISCLDKKGQSVIDQKITGFVVDTDGKIGLRGRVVSKMGAAIARSMLAGFFGGVGQVIQQANTTTSQSPLGATSTINPNQALAAGLGSGLTAATQELQKFYLELAKQQMPVIEVGATRKVTIVVSQGTTLNIKELNGMGVKK